METSPDIAQSKEEFRRSFRHTFYEYKYLLVLCSTYVLALFGLGMASGATLLEYLIFFGLAILFALCFAIWFAGRALFIFLKHSAPDVDGKNTNSPKAKEAFDLEWAQWFTGRRAAIILITYLVFTQALFIGAAKSLIRIFNDYSWDPFLSKLDYTLHGGHYPHQLVQAVFNDSITAFIFDFTYGAWYFYIFVNFILCALLDKNRQRQAQFLWTHILSWIVLGSIVATIFSSVGPCYYLSFYPDLINPYSDLRGGGFFGAQTSQQTFIAMYLHTLVTNETVIDVNAISAFPSLHVATAWMFALYARSINQLYYWFAVIFTLMILIGSIHFGWHYAIDGYVGIIGVQLLWWVGGRIAKKQTSPD